MDWANWKEVALRLREIHPYALEISYGPDLRKEVLETLYGLVGRTRWGLPAEVAELVHHIGFGVLPIFSLVSRAATKPAETDAVLFESAVRVASDLTYDAIKYLHDLAVMDSGARLLWSVLRFARLNGLNRVKARCLEAFGFLVDTARKSRFEEAVAWLEFQRDDALALPKDKPPSLPTHVEAAIRATRGSGLLGS